MRHLILAVSICAILGACGYEASTLRVQELSCEGVFSVTSYEDCNGKLKVGSRLIFHVNATTKNVALEVDHNAGDWFVKSFLYKECAIANSKNWECTNGLETIGFATGEYRRKSSGILGYEIRGLSGLHYWSSRLGLTDPEKFGRGSNPPDKPASRKEEKTAK